MQISEKDTIVTKKVLSKRQKLSKEQFNNTLDSKYQKLLFNILSKGHKKLDRTGTGTYSIFGTTIRHNMKEGFPLLTTKKMAWKQIVTELLWFIRGETNIQPLVQVGNLIWVGDAYKNYRKVAGQLEEPDYSVHVEDLSEHKMRLMSKDEFVERIKLDNEFAAKWGDMGPIYGKQWIKWSVTDEKTGDVTEFDQLSDVIARIKTNPDDRRLLVTAWNPGEIKSMVLPPCHILFQFWSRELTVTERVDIYNYRMSRFYDEFAFKTPNSYTENYWSQLFSEFNIPQRALSLQWYQRSVDTPLGLPFNIASYALLLEIVAAESKMVSEDLIFVGGDTHIYTNQLDGVDKQLSRETLHSLPTLSFDISNNGQSIIEQIRSKELVWHNFGFNDTYKSQDKIEFPLSN